MIKTDNNFTNRIQQGDIISNVDYIEYIKENNGEIEASIITFPLVVVLSQECDLTWDFDNRTSAHINQDKRIFSIIVAPLYNYEHFMMGEHLSELDLKMRVFSQKPKSTEKKILCQNETPRYHYLDFTENDMLVSSVIDFKHFFTINVDTLMELKKSNYVCSLPQLYRERVTQRFSNYLSRIGLPDIAEPLEEG